MIGLPELLGVHLSHRSPKEKDFELFELRRLDAALDFWIKVPGCQPEPDQSKYPERRFAQHFKYSNLVLSACSQKRAKGGVPFGFAEGRIGANKCRYVVGVLLFLEQFLHQTFSAGS